MIRIILMNVFEMDINPNTNWAIRQQISIMNVK
jgi:hypothetical protein